MEEKEGGPAGVCYRKRPAKGWLGLGCRPKEPGKEELAIGSVGEWECREVEVVHG